MILTPKHEPDNTYTLVEPTGKTFKRDFANYDAAVTWAEANGHSVFKTSGGPIPDYIPQPAGPVDDDQVRFDDDGDLL